MESTSRFSPLFLLWFLGGDRTAIQAALDCRSLFWVAVLLTLSAGLAREYDGEYLLAKPVYLIIPLLVALAMGSVLCGVLCLTSWRSASCRSWELWPKFLTCYLLLAPTAWLYAIPYERWYDELEATRHNLTTLSIVSCWRVLVITRVASVLFNRGYFVMLFPVLLFSSTAVGIAGVLNLSLATVMGGVRLTEVEYLVQNFSDRWYSGACVSLPLWLVGVLYLAIRAKQATPPAENANKVRVTTPLWALSVASVLVWGFLLPGPQREQRLRYETERLFLQNQFSAALQMMSAHTPGDYPPLWKPPPLKNRAYYSPDLLLVMEHFTATEPTGWARDVYITRLTGALRGERPVFLFRESDQMRIIALLTNLPEGRQIVIAAAPNLREFQQGDYSKGARSTITAILKLADEAPPAPTSQK